MRALLTDLDRTLTGPDLVPDPRALARLADLEAAGVSVVVITGRPLEYLTGLRLHEVCSALVAENGALVGFPKLKHLEVFYPGWAEKAREALGAVAKGLNWGHVLGSGPAPLASQVVDTLRSAGVPHGIAFNAEEMMVLPTGVDKASGALRALYHLGVRPEEAAAVGDGDNDVALFRVVGRSAAVANAATPAREAASRVLAGAYADGFLEFTEALLTPNEAPPGAP